jgi:hypothetical protein
MKKIISLLVFCLFIISYFINPGLLLAHNYSSYDECYVDRLIYYRSTPGGGSNLDSSRANTYCSSLDYGGSSSGDSSSDDSSMDWDNAGSAIGRSVSVNTGDSVTVDIDYSRVWTLEFNGRFPLNEHKRYAQTSDSGNPRGGLDFFLWNGNKLASRLYDRVIVFGYPSIGSKSSYVPPDHWAMSAGISGLTHDTHRVKYEYRPSGSWKAWYDGQLVMDISFGGTNIPSTRSRLYIYGFNGTVKQTLGSSEQFNIQSYNMSGGYQSTFNAADFYSQLASSTDYTQIIANYTASSTAYIQAHQDDDNNDDYVTPYVNNTAIENFIRQVHSVCLGESLTNSELQEQLDTFLEEFDDAEAYRDEICLSIEAQEYYEDNYDTQDQSQSTDDITDLVMEAIMERFGNQSAPEGYTYQDLQDAIALIEMLQSMGIIGGGNSSSNTNFNNSTSGYTRNLTVGSQGNDVMRLQQFLNQNGYPIAYSGTGSRGQESTYFGELTRQALIRYQLANNISPASGYFGPLTRASITGGNYVTGDNTISNVNVNTNTNTGGSGVSQPSDPVVPVDSGVIDIY